MASYKVLNGETSNGLTLNDKDTMGYDRQCRLLRYVAIHKTGDDTTAGDRLAGCHFFSGSAFFCCISDSRRSISSASSSVNALNIMFGNSVIRCLALSVKKCEMDLP